MNENPLIVCTAVAMTKPALNFVLLDSSQSEVAIPIEGMLWARQVVQSKRND
jgi:hypothetical protein